MTREASFGGILGETMSLVADTKRDVALFTLVVGGLTAVGAAAGLTDTTAGALNFGFQVDANDSPERTAFEVVLIIANVVATYWLLKRYLAARGRLGEGLNGFWSYIGMSILSVIAIVCGFFLLVVPGLILLVRWSAASGFLLGAGESITDSLAASWRATKGHAWAIFFAALVLLVGMILVAAVAVALFGVAGPTFRDVASAFVESAASAVFVGFGIAVFCLVDDMRRVDEVFA